MKTALLLLLSTAAYSDAFNASIRLARRPVRSSPSAQTSTELAQQIHDECSSDNPLADLYHEKQQRSAEENEALLSQLEKQQARYEKPKEETQPFVFDGPSGAAMDPDEYQWYMRSRLEQKFREPTT